MLLTKVFRMLIKWRSYNRARKGTIKYQALARGYNVRREFATVKTQKYFRRYTARKRFTMLKSATIALQCRVREKAAKKVLAELLKEQKDVGKLKQNNEKLKEEMASLRAMLSAQAKEGAASKAHEEELAKKEAQIAALEKRIAEIEKELAAAKSRVEELESQSKAQQEAIARDKDQIKKLQTVRPQAIATRSKSGENVTTMPHGDIPANFIGAEKLNEHRAKVAILEEELEAERKFRREADGEIIRLRAKINGVELSEAELKDLLAKKVDIPGLKPEPMSEESSLADGDAARLRYVAACCRPVLLLGFRTGVALMIVKLCCSCLFLFSQVHVFCACCFAGGGCLCWFFPSSTHPSSYESEVAFQRFLRSNRVGKLHFWLFYRQRRSTPT